ncbi:MAG: type II toxin-antitoxin system RelE/ParE family toxin [bacterium]
MIVVVDKSFDKDTDNINNKSIRINISQSIKNAQNAENINQIKNIKKLKGFSNEYRIKIGNYRLGIRIEKDTVKFIRCLHRKDIYRYFPK